MRRIVKFPALMVARPPRHKNAKIAVCAFDTSVELEECTPSRFPVALVAGDTEFRYLDGKLYRQANMDVDTLFKRNESNFVDSRRHNFLTGHIVREMYREVAGIDDYANDRFWPKAALHLLKNGMNTEWAEVKAVASESSLLDFRGPWMEKAAQANHLQPFLENPEKRIARYERLTQEAFGQFKVLNGQVWAMADEPCLVARRSRDAERFESVRLVDVRNYRRDADLQPGTSWWDSLENGIFPVSAQDDVMASMNSDYRGSGEPIEILIPEAFTANIVELEIDRCARLLAREFAESLDRLGKRSSLELPTTPTMDAWTSLVQFTKSYEPTLGVPDEVEDRICALIDSVSSGGADRNMLSDRSLELASLIMADWRDRAFDIGFAEKRTVAP